jgi:DNA polymerase-3 subunit alpha
MNIEVLGPDVNESNLTFTVNKKGNIRFGLGAIKGVGANAVAGIVAEREKNAFKDIFDFVERVNLNVCNKKNIEALAQAGAFDNFPGIKREHFFVENGNGESFSEVLLRFGNKMQADKMVTQTSLFGGSAAVAITRPELPQIEEWSILEKLNREKELIGMYLSAHPLDPFRLEMKKMTNVRLEEFQNLSKLEGKEFSVAGLVTNVRDAVSKNGNRWASLMLADFSGSHDFRFFSKDYEHFREFFNEGFSLFIKGIVQKNYRDELEVKIKTITKLSNVKEEMLKSISLNLPLSLITDEWLNRLNAQVESNKGNTLVKFKIIDAEENQTVDMFSRNMKIKLSPEIIDFLKEQEIEFRLNC